MNAESVKEGWEFGSKGLESISEGFRGVSASILSRPLIKALEIGHVQWAIRHVAEVERQLSDQGMGLDFAHCPDLIAEIRSAYQTCVSEGLDSQAQALARSFEKYFAISGTDAEE